MNKILITGGTGFIGSHLSEILVKKGYDVVVFDRYNPNNHWGWLEYSKYKNDLEVILGDIRDYDSISKAMVGCDIVFHLAALIGIPYSYISPLAYIRTNIDGTLSLPMDISAPGIFLSHAATTNKPSMLSPNTTVSIESAITSLLTKEAFIPSVPIDIPSLIVIVPNPKGTRFAALTPDLAAFAIRSKCILHGVTSLAKLAIATNGFSKSSSSNPEALNIALAAALSGPST